MFDKGHALLVVDVQRDFCEEGTLPVPEGDRVVPVLNRVLEAAERAGVPIYLSRDWHPMRHPSFRQQGGDWPPHCIQDSEGAAFHPNLYVPPGAELVSKGTRFDRDQYSAFDETGLATELERRGVRVLWVGGLAQDVCVRSTTLDALRAGFAVNVMIDATRPIDKARGEAAVAEMKAKGARIVTAADTHE